MINAEYEYMEYLLGFMVATVIFVAYIFWRIKKDNSYKTN